MFNLKNFANAVVNSNSITVKVVGYTALAAVGIGADIIGASVKKAEKVKVAEAPAPVTEEVHDDDILEEVIHDDDIVVEVVHDEEAYKEDPADVEFETELFDAAIKSTSNSFELACEEAIEARKYGDEGAVVAMEGMAKAYLNYLQLNLGKEDECLAVHNAREALAAFRAFGPTRIEWM